MSAHSRAESCSSATCAPQPLLPFALEYSHYGLCIIPIVKMQKKGARKWKRYQRVRPSVADLRLWFADADNHQLGMGVVLGQVSGGLLCRDFDKPGSYEAWARAEPRLARILPTAHAYRGNHVYFRSLNYPLSPRGTFIRNLGDGELRGDGHIAVLAPSLHAKSGQPYSWLTPFTNEIPYAELGAFGIEEAGANVTQGNLCVTSGMPPGFPPPPPNFNSDRPFGAIGTFGDAVLDAIRATLPDGPGKRHRKVFEFARHLRSIEGVAGLAPDELIPYLEYWYQWALPVITTKDFATTEQDFRNAWPLVKTPAGGEGSIKRAFERAISAPLPTESDQFKIPAIKLLVSLCRELQRETGSKPFYLACRDAATILGVTGVEPHVRAWRWLEKLCHVGILRKVRRGSQTEHRANEYHYLFPF